MKPQTKETDKVKCSITKQESEKRIRKIKSSNKLNRLYETDINSYLEYFKK